MPLPVMANFTVRYVRSTPGVMGMNTSFWSAGTNVDCALMMGNDTSSLMPVDIQRGVSRGRFTTSVAYTAAAYASSAFFLSAAVAVDTSTGPLPLDPSPNTAFQKLFHVSLRSSPMSVLPIGLCTLAGGSFGILPNPSSPMISSAVILPSAVIAANRCSKSAMSELALPPRVSKNDLHLPSSGPRFDMTEVTLEKWMRPAVAPSVTTRVTVADLTDPSVGTVHEPLKLARIQDESAATG
ncbi:Uncharacterised protein [Mycobacteroides abscessus subsp. abscessus]|nr:Uncharacterised protein [Mycobacteroides abscessus subsp. abscessus]